jgi:hypothetical protein
MERIDSLGKLSEQINSARLSGELEELIDNAIIYNSWFTKAGIEEAFTAIQNEFLSKTKLEEFIQKYQFNNTTPKRVGLVLAGNIPMVGIHDILMVYLTGNIAVIKYSEKDQVLIQWLISKLCESNPDIKTKFEEVEKLTNIDAVIATGSDNSSRYFEAYFGKYPNIIRKNRNSIGIIKADSSDEDLRLLSHDILSYFGLGCRNVSKVYFERGFNIDQLMRILDENTKVMHHNKYRNNYDYNLSLFLLNKKKFLQNGTTLLVEDEGLASRIATLHYEWFDDLNLLEDKLNHLQDKIQCIVSNYPLQKLSYLPLGQSQSPAISDFADGVDTVEFLLSL